MDWQVTIEPIKGKSGDPANDLAEARTFPPGTEKIVFGRESTCDVVFPAEARIVGRRHGQLRRQDSGDYVIEAFGEHYFEVNGYPPQPGQPIPTDATIRFGDPKGPMIHVRLTRQAAGDDPGATAPQRPVEPISKVAAQIRIAVAALAVVVVIGGGTFGVMNYLANARLDQFTRQMDEINTAMSKAVGDTFGDTEFLRKAAFAVILENTNGRPKVIGTAWPLRPGMLVTNAHVAEIMNSLKPGESLAVRKFGATDDIAVKDKIIHAGYSAFNDFVDTAIKESKGFASLTDGVAMPSAYDVALLEVDPAIDIGPALTLSDDPAALTSGASLAFAGYPIEGTGAQNTSVFSPNPQVQFGRVTALSDYFLFRADTPNALLVENSLPATGGASGSPIVDSTGKVVAVLSGGTVDVRNGVRTPSAVMLNYAQRADLIKGLLDPATFDIEAARTEWQKALKLFDGHKDTVVADARSALEQETGGPVTQEPTVPASLKTSEAVEAGTVRYREHAAPMLAGHSYTFIAYGEYSGTLNLVLLRNGKGIAATHGSSWFANLTYTADHDETLTLRVLGEAKHQVDYDLITLSGQKSVALAVPSTN